MVRYFWWIGVLFCCALVVARPCINPEGDAGEYIRQLGLVGGDALPRLHLGCGQTYFSGYINIDFPSDEHTVQQYSRADVFADITRLRFAESSVKEIRLHHVFEHFNRSMALALLCAWHLWLVQGGELVIEVPDFATSMNMLVDDRYTYVQKQVIMRHIFGSHEASWAIHCDGWYKEKFEHVLTVLGFDDIEVRFSSWQLTHNITVRAKKQRIRTRDQLVAAAQTLLAESMVDRSESEQRMCQQWLHNVIIALDNLTIVKRKE